MAQTTDEIKKELKEYLLIHNNIDFYSFVSIATHWIKAIFERDTVSADACKKTQTINFSFLDKNGNRHNLTIKKDNNER